MMRDMSGVRVRRLPYLLSAIAALLIAVLSSVFAFVSGSGGRYLLPSVLGVAVLVAGLLSLKTPRRAALLTLAGAVLALPVPVAGLIVFASVLRRQPFLVSACVFWGVVASALLLHVFLASCQYRSPAIPR